MAHTNAAPKELGLQFALFGAALVVLVLEVLEEEQGAVPTSFNMFKEQGAVVAASPVPSEEEKKKKPAKAD